MNVDDVKGWHMRERAHYNGGKAFFAYLMQCIEQPRLSRYDRYDRKTRSHESTWKVDGIDQPSFEAALAALDTPPIFSDAELQELEKVTDEWVDIRKTMDFGLNMSLESKGAVEWQDGKCRRRKAPK